MGIPPVTTNRWQQRAGAPRQLLKQHRPQLLLQLERSHRFNDSTALGALCSICAKAATPLRCNSNREVETAICRWPLQQGWPLALQQRLSSTASGWNKRQQQRTQRCEALACLEELLVLSPRRSGRQGVSQLNRRWLPLTQKEPWHWPRDPAGGPQ